MSKSDLLNVTKGAPIPSFGVGATDVVAMQKVTETAKRTLKIVINGNVVDLIKCDEIHINLDSSLIELQLTINNATQDTPEIEPETDDVIAPLDETTLFEMAGDPLEQFINSSPIRSKLNNSERILQNTSKASAVIELETIIYNIQEANAVELASLELLEKEKIMTDNDTGDCILNVAIPKFNFPTESGPDGFKLTESVTVSVPTH